MSKVSKKVKLTTPQATAMRSIRSGIGVYISPTVWRQLFAKGLVNIAGGEYTLTEQGKEIQL